MRLPLARAAGVAPATLTALALSASLLAATPASAAPTDQGRAGAAPTSAAAYDTVAERKPVPSLRISTRARGLSHPWDVKPLGNGRLLITERPGQLTVATRDGSTRRVEFPTHRIFAQGETGLMGLAVDPNYDRNRRFYTCAGWKKRDGGHDIRVHAWRMNPRATRAKRIKPLVRGIPSTSGRHGGCRLLITRGGKLIVGTGDAAVGSNPRNTRSLGGKTLRLSRFSGKPARSNPFARSGNRARRYVLTYGHRNVQGLAQRRDGTLWSVEHGPDRNDEVNKLVSGGDYGWHPVPGYNESVPMTDRSLPGRQYGARWRSGRPTLATSGSTFVRGRKWGRYQGALAVAGLKSEQVLFMKLNRRDRVRKVYAPRALRRFGRLRTVTRLPDNNLLVVTDGGNGSGRVLLVEPR